MLLDPALSLSLSLVRTRVTVAEIFWLKKERKTKARFVKAAETT